VVALLRLSEMETAPCPLIELGVMLGGLVITTHMWTSAV
jgi:hypothetical protein